MKIISFFAGAGGLDLGFKKAGFSVIWANENDKCIWDTYKLNHKDTLLEQRSITKLKSSEIPECEGIIGGPPCQSWSEAGALKGIDDKRGKLFFDFIRILKDKQPKFFLAENVSGMLHKRNEQAFNNIKDLFTGCGYNLTVRLLNASDYEVPQDRKRVFFVGYRNDLHKKFNFPSGNTFFQKITLRDAIGDIHGQEIPAQSGNKANGEKCSISNHEYMTGGFSSIFMSRNRVRSWDDVSFTIQAGGRHAPIHPQAPKMISIGKDKRVFAPEAEHLYRRLTVRECARIQTFPDNFVFLYERIADGYKMVGNAVPVNLAKSLANEIYKDLSKLEKHKRSKSKRINSANADVL